VGGAAGQRLRGEKHEWPYSLEERNNDHGNSIHIVMFYLEQQHKAVADKKGLLPRAFDPKAIGANLGQPHQGETLWPWGRRLKAVADKKGPNHCAPNGEPL